MRIPRPKPPIDVDNLREALAARQSGVAFARRTGYTRDAVYYLLRRSGIRPTRPARKVRDGTDATLRTIWGSLLERCEKPGSRLYRNRPADRAWTEPIPESGSFAWTAEQRSVVGYRFGMLKG